MTLGRTVVILSPIREKGCEIGSGKKQVGGRRNRKVGKGWGTKRREGLWVKRPSSNESLEGKKEAMVWGGGTSWLQGKGRSPEPWEAQRMRTAEKKPMFLRNLLCAGLCSRHLHICAVVYNSAKETFCRDSTFQIQ